MLGTSNTNDKLLIKNSRKTNYIYIFSVVFIIGVFAGCVICTNLLKADNRLIFALGDSLIALKQCGSFLRIFIYSIGLTFIFFALQIIVGFSALGRYLLFLQLFVYASSSGLVLTYIYFNFYENFMWPTVFAFVFLIHSLCFVLLSKESFKLSHKIYQVIFKNYSREDISRDCKDYLVKTIILLSFDTLVCLLETVTYTVIVPFLSKLD